jgi:hypothetical protein
VAGLRQESISSPTGRRRQNARPDGLRCPPTLVETNPRSLSVPLGGGILESGTQFAGHGTYRKELTMSAKKILMLVGDYV